MNEKNLNNLFFFIIGTKMGAIFNLTKNLIFITPGSTYTFRLDSKNSGAGVQNLFWMTFRYWRNGRRY
ncbi:hypothetical protein BGP_4647 [Beggiatoa sp. PS]|nr:hypothetical protein BGP_4647 [Beggiatoa sp. PS]